MLVLTWYNVGTNECVDDIEVTELLTYAELLLLLGLDKETLYLCGSYSLSKEQRQYLQQRLKISLKDSYDYFLETRDARGIEVSYKDSREEDVQNYRKAAMQGNANAQYRLGWMYAHGHGVNLNNSFAFSWYLRANKHSRKAQYAVGWMYEHGLGVKQDFIQALQWYRKAATEDYVAQYNLGRMYEGAKEVFQDYTQGYPKAQNQLGVMYQEGCGVTQNDTEAINWYRKAAEQRYALAQYNLGWMYEHAKGVPQDYRQAVVWYHRAAEQGCCDAKSCLQEIDVMCLLLMIENKSSVGLSNTVCQIRLRLFALFSVVAAAAG